MATKAKKKDKIRVLSPDGFDIMLDGDFPTFNDLEAAREGAQRWADSYKPQGFYSTIKDGMRVRIPIDEIIDHCYFLKADGSHIE